ASRRVFRSGRWYHAVRPACRGGAQAMNGEEGGMLLEGKVAIVTGAGHGIRRAYSLGIAREGGKVVVADIDGAAADTVAEEISGEGGQALAVHSDVSKLESCQDLARQALNRFGQIDGLINNAAIFATIPISRVGYQEI